MIKCAWVEILTKWFESEKWQWAYQFGGPTLVFNTLGYKFEAYIDIEKHIIEIGITGLAGGDGYYSPCANIKLEELYDPDYDPQLVLDRIKKAIHNKINQLERDGLW